MSTSVLCLAVAAALVALVMLRWLATMLIRVLGLAFLVAAAVLIIAHPHIHLNAHSLGAMLHTGERDAQQFLRCGQSLYTEAGSHKQHVRSAGCDHASKHVVVSHAREVVKQLAALPRTAGDTARRDGLLSP